MPEQNENEDLRQLRRLAEQGQAAQDENVVLRRQMAFRDAGYDPRNPMVRFAMEHYDGDPTEDAVRTFAEGLGIQVQAASPAPTPAPPPVPTPDATINSELVSTRQSLVADGNPATPPAERQRTDPWDAVFLRKAQAVRKGEDMEDVAAQCVEAVIGAGMMGDQRVLVQKRRNAMGRSIL